MFRNALSKATVIILFLKFLRYKFVLFVCRYAEAGLYQAGNISSSSGASSGSHPASPLPHSLFTHEPLYQFYNAAKVEVRAQYKQKTKVCF